MSCLLHRSPTVVGTVTGEMSLSVRSSRSRVLVSLGVGDESEQEDVEQERGRLRPVSTSAIFWMLNFWNKKERTKKKKKTKVGKETVGMGQSLQSVFV